jgi:hypothetical protein
MAIKKTLQINGVTIPECYVRVSRYQGTKTQLSLTIDFCADKDAKPIYQQNIETGINPSGDNVLTQAYTRLKAIDQFAGAVDC